MKDLLCIKNVASFFVIVSVLVGAWFVFSNEQVQAQTGSRCHIMFPGVSIPNGFGVPYDVFTQQQLISANCDSRGITVSAGDVSGVRYVYEQGYEYRNNTWVPFNFSGSKQGALITGVAQATLSTQGENPRYFVAYICTWNVSQWFCGCQDQSCAQPSWQLQAAQQFTGAGSTSGSGSSSSGGTSSGGGSSSGSSSGAGATCGGGQCSVCQACGGNCNQCGGNRTVWVDGRNGNDSNNGLSQGQAFRTIQKGANTVRGGDVMIVRPGKYYERPTFSNLGSSANNPVWILSEIPGEATISGLWRAVPLQFAWRFAGWLCEWRKKTAIWFC